MKPSGKPQTGAASARRREVKTIACLTIVRLKRAQFDQLRAAKTAAEKDKALVNLNLLSRWLILKSTKRQLGCDNPCTRQARYWLWFFYDLTPAQVARAMREGVALSAAPR